MSAHSHDAISIVEERKMRCFHWKKISTEQVTTQGTTSKRIVDL